MTKTELAWDYVHSKTKADLEVMYTCVDQLLDEIQNEERDNEDFYELLKFQIHLNNLIHYGSVGYFPAVPDFRGY